MGKKWFVIVIAILVVLSAGMWVYFYYYHHTVKIGDVINNPRDYREKTLVMTGKVVERKSLVLKKIFILQDDTGQITVVTDRMLPAIGAQVRVKGHIREAIAIGDVYKLVLIEE